MNSQVKLFSLNFIPIIKVLRSIKSDVSCELKQELVISLWPICFLSFYRNNLTTIFSTHAQIYKYQQSYDNTGLFIRIRFTCQ